jgi:O-antigen/teichoic acid export membrane protein
MTRRPDGQTSVRSTAPPGDVDPARYVTNTVFLFIEKGAKLLLTLLISILLARHLGDRDFGIFNFAISYAALFSGLASLGLESLVVRDLVHGKEDPEVLLGTTFAFRLLGGFLIYGLLALSTLFLQEPRQTRILIGIVGLSMILQAFQVIELFFQARVQAKFTVLAELVALALYAASILILIQWRASLESFALTSLVQSVCIAVGLVAVYRHQGLSLRAWRLDLSVASRLFGDSWPLLFSSMMIPIIQNADRVLIQRYLSPEMLGNYAVAVTLSSVWNTIPIVLCTSLLPAIVEARKADLQRYSLVLQRLHHVMLWVSVLIALVASLLAEWIVSVLYGASRYPFAGSALATYVWTIVPMSVGIISTYWLIVEGLQRIYPIRTFATLLVIVGLNLALIPRLGINGAAIAAICAQVVAVHLVYLPDKRTRAIARMQVSSVLLPLRVIRSALPR